MQFYITKPQKPKEMKKLNITIALVLFLSFSALAEGRYTTLFFNTLDGIQLSLRVYAEEEVDEPLLFDANKHHANSLKTSLPTLNGKTLDLSEITVPEKDFEEPIDTKAVFKEYASSQRMSAAK